MGKKLRHNFFQQWDPAPGLQAIRVKKIFYYVWMDIPVLLTVLITQIAHGNVVMNTVDEQSVQ